MVFIPAHSVWRLPGKCTGEFGYECQSVPNDSRTPERPIEAQEASKSAAMVISIQSRSRVQSERFATRELSAWSAKNFAVSYGNNRIRRC